MEDQVEVLLSDLHRLSPMPNDESLDAETIIKYQAIVEGLWELYDERCIQPLIASFGYGSGFGVYWTVVHLIERFKPELTEPILIQALSDINPGSRMWGALMLRGLQSHKALPALRVLLTDPYELVRAEAVSTLAVVGGVSERSRIEQLRDDPSPDVRFVVNEALKELA